MVSAHALAQGFEFLPGAVPQAKPREPAIDFRRDTAPAAQLAVKFEQRVYFHLAIHAALLRQVADRAGTRARWSFAEHPHRSAIRMQDVGDHSHRGGFARAVRTDETVDGPLLHGERQPVNRGDVAKRFGHAGEFDGLHSRNHIRTGCPSTYTARAVSRPPKYGSSR